MVKFSILIKHHNPKPSQAKLISVIRSENCWAATYREDYGMRQTNRGFQIQISVNTDALPIQRPRAGVDEFPFDFPARTRHCPTRSSHEPVHSQAQRILIRNCRHGELPVRGKYAMVRREALRQTNHPLQ